jgi:hypothetical protein
MVAWGKGKSMMFQSTTARKKKLFCSDTSDDKQCPATNSGFFGKSLSSSNKSEGKIRARLNRFLTRALVPLVFASINVALLNTLRFGVADITCSLTGIPWNEYFTCTGISGHYSEQMTFFASLGFWFGWFGVSGGKKVSRWLVPILFAAIAILNPTMVPILISALLLKSLGAFLAKKLPANIFNSSVKAAIIAYGSAMVVSFLGIVLHEYLSLHVLALLTMATAIIAPAVMIGGSTCRDRKAAMQVAMLLQSPLLVGTLCYCIFSIGIAAMHTLAYPLLNEMTMAAGGGPIIAEASTLWIKAGLICAYTAAVASFAAFGGILGTKGNEKRFARLMRSSA